MKVGIISDIHGNDNKLWKVLDELSDCEKIYNLGDNFGDYGDSNRVVELIDRENIKNVLGNHDLEIILEKTLPADEFMAEILHGSTELLRSEYDLTAESKEFIDKLEPEYRMNSNGISYGFFHAFKDTFKGDIYFKYIDKTNAVEFNNKFQSDVAFYWPQTRSQPYRHRYK